MPGPPPSRDPVHRYHHGNLRVALIDEALRTIEEGGVEHFSLREAAARVGVSSSAAYKHFADKAELLAEVARGGFAAMAQEVETAMTAARARGRGARQRAQAAFEAQGVAYVRFAVAQPTRYRVMFGPFGAASKRDVNGRSVISGRTPYELLLSSLDELNDVGLLHASRREEAPRLFWSLVHGLSDLMISGLLDCRDEESLKRTTVLMTRAVLAGLQAPP